MGIMEDVAIAAGANYAALSQHNLKEVGSGQCFGLSNAWLGYRAKSSKNFLRDIENEGKVLTDALRFQKFQSSTNSKASVAKENGLIEAQGTDSKKTFQANDEGSLADMADWMCSTTFTSRYFLVSSDKHTMAAVGGGAICNRFYDPNAGIISVYSGANFKDFLQKFFTTVASHPRAGPYYWVDGKRGLSVTKLQKI